MGEEFKADPNDIWEMNLEADLNQVKEIWKVEVKEAHKPFIPEAFWDSKTVIDNFLKELSKQTNERYVYKDDKDEIGGFIIAWLTTRERAYLAELYISSQYQRRKIGTVLFETLQGKNPKFPQLKGRYSKFTSSVYAHNYRSFAWHIKRDFIVCGIKFCPHTGLPKYEMVWEKNKYVNRQSISSTTKK